MNAPGFSIWLVRTLEVELNGCLRLLLLYAEHSAQTK